MCTPRCFIPYSACILLCFLAAYCGTPNSSSDEILARVGGATLRVSELRDALPEGENPGITETQAVSYIQRWINAELLRQEARRRGMHKTKRLKRVLANTERDLLANALLEQEVGRFVEVSDDEIQAFYNLNRDNYLRKEAEAHAFQILVATLDEANQIRTEIRAGAPFDSMATVYSIDATSEKGGDMGYFSREQVLPQLANIAFSQRIDYVSQAVRTDLGYHILKVVDRQPAETVKDISQVKNEIRENISVQKIRNVHRQLTATLREAADIYINYPMVSTALEDSTR